jgi:hypothetical protein
MKFNNQRPESLNGDLKRIALEFTQRGQEKERALVGHFVQHVLSGNENNHVHIDDWKVLSVVSKSTREYERVKFTNCFIQAITIKANNNKVVKLKAELIDLSAGGACIAIPDGIKVSRRKKNPEFPFEDPPNIKIKLDFLGGVVLKGVIRYLKTPKLDPAVDLDNYDFENVLPQYWKINA